MLAFHLKLSRKRYSSAIGKTFEILPLILNTIKGRGDAVDDKDDFNNVKNIIKQLIKRNSIIYDSF